MSDGDWTLKEAQQRVDAWIRSLGVRYFSELTNLAQLVEEVGEVARILSRTHGDQSFKPSDREAKLSDELADVLFVLICLANQTGVDLQAALEANLNKKSARDGQRHVQNPKLFRPSGQPEAPGQPEPAGQHDPARQSDPAGRSDGDE